MAPYKHILACLDLSEESEQVLATASSLAEAYQAKLSICHVLEPIIFAYGGDIPMDLTELQEHMHSRASKHLEQLSCGVDIEQRHTLVGQAAAEIHLLCELQRLDLVVVGSHGSQGLSLLLGSTANAVLHGASTDVLAVRIQSQE